MSESNKFTETALVSLACAKAIKLVKDRDATAIYGLLGALQAFKDNDRDVLVKLSESVLGRRAKLQEELTKTSSAELANRIVNGLGVVARHAIREFMKENEWELTLIELATLDLDALAQSQHRWTPDCLTELRRGLGEWGLYPGMSLMEAGAVVDPSLA
jgi:hypothetical protein